MSAEESTMHERWRHIIRDEVIRQAKDELGAYVDARLAERGNAGLDAVTRAYASSIAQDAANRIVATRVDEVIQRKLVKYILGGALGLIVTVISSVWVTASSFTETTLAEANATVVEALNTRVDEAVKRHTGAIVKTAKDKVEQIQKDLEAATQRSDVAVSILDHQVLGLNDRIKEADLSLVGFNFSLESLNGDLQKEEARATELRRRIENLTNDKLAAASTLVTKLAENPELGTLIRDKTLLSERLNKIENVFQIRNDDERLIATGGLPEVIVKGRLLVARSEPIKATGQTALTAAKLQTVATGSWKDAIKALAVQVSDNKNAAARDIERTNERLDPLCRVFVVKEPNMRELSLPDSVPEVLVNARLLMQNSPQIERRFIESIGRKFENRLIISGQQIVSMGNHGYTKQNRKEQGQYFLFASAEETESFRKITSSGEPDDRRYLKP